MEIDSELKTNLIADVENVCNIFLDEETKETLKRCFEITIGTYNLSIERAKAKTTHESSGLHKHFVSNCPEWLSDADKTKAIELYKAKKIDGVKFLTEIARPYLVTPLKWANEFLQGCC